jgi:hypothetical protein
MKYSKVYIGVLNKKNAYKLEEIQQVAGICFVFLPNLNIFELSINQLKILQNNFILIPNKENIKRANKYKKSHTYALFVDWLLKQPTEVKFLLANDSLLYVAHKDEAWHKQYDGLQGYAITSHIGEEYTKFYGHSASITDSSDKLILKEFDGISLENTQS